MNTSVKYYKGGNEYSTSVDLSNANYVNDFQGLTVTGDNGAHLRVKGTPAEMRILGHAMLSAAADMDLRVESSS